MVTIVGKKNYNFYDAVYSPVILILNAVVVAVVMLLSASGNPRILTLFGMSAGTAVAVINYISQIFSPVESLGMEIQTIQSAIAGIHRINEFLALEENPTRNRNISEATDNPSFKSASAVFNVPNINFNNDSDIENVSVPFVEFKDVTFGYDEHTVLEHMNFQIMDGDQVTFSGRTGAGKSTILKLLLGLYEPQSGRSPDSWSPGFSDSTGIPPKTFRLRRTVLSHGSRNCKRSDHTV